MIIEYIQGRGCIDCGETDPCVLEFDHVNGIKDANISSMVRQGWGKQRMIAEIAKCVIRCANCYRRRTARQFSWWQCRLGT
jgi:bacterioferritin-associated ferredoxin